MDAGVPVAGLQGQALGFGGEPLGVPDADRVPAGRPVGTQHGRDGGGADELVDLAAGHQGAVRPAHPQAGVQLLDADLDHDLSTPGGPVDVGHGLVRDLGERIGVAHAGPAVVVGAGRFGVHVQSGLQTVPGFGVEQAAGVPPPVQRLGQVELALVPAPVGVVVEVLGTVLLDDVVDEPAQILGIELAGGLDHVLLGVAEILTQHPVGAADRDKFLLTDPPGRKGRSGCRELVAQRPGGAHHATGIRHSSGVAQPVSSRAGPGDLRPALGVETGDRLVAQRGQRRLGGHDHRNSLGQL